MQKGVPDKNQYGVYPNETARYEPSLVDLHCSQRYLNLYIGMKGLMFDKKTKFMKVCFVSFPTSYALSKKGTTLK